MNYHPLEMSAKLILFALVVCCLTASTPAVEPAPPGRHGILVATVTWDTGRSYRTKHRPPHTISIVNSARLRLVWARGGVAIQCWAWVHSVAMVGEFEPVDDLRPTDGATDWSPQNGIKLFEHTPDRYPVIINMSEARLFNLAPGWQFAYARSDDVFLGPSRLLSLTVPLPRHWSSLPIGGL